jgi:RNA polymerase primary sigma factor
MRQLKISKSITNRDSQSIDKYLAEISKHDMVTAEEEVILAKKIREGDQQALEKLVVANLRFVVSVAKQYQHQGLSLSDLINEGNVGLIKAASRFDETRGFKFISYAVWWIRQCIIQAVAVNSKIIRVPLNKIGALRKIKVAGGVLEQKLEREASYDELAEALEMSAEEIKLTLESTGRHVSTDSPFANNEDSTLLDLLHDPTNPMPDNLLMASSLNSEIKTALKGLSERESETIMLFYGIGLEHPLTLEEIAQRQNITRERVRQIKDKAIRRLRVGKRSSVLKNYLG